MIGVSSSIPTPNITERICKARGDTPFCFSFERMKVKVLQRSRITRYEGSFPSLSAFLLCPNPSLSDSETAEIRADGALTRLGDDVSLTYKERESGVRVSVEKRGDTLTVARGGGTLSFTRGARTAFEYRTSYGTLPTEAYTEDITLQEKDNSCLLTLVYTAVFGGMAQKNEMRFKITF